MANVATCGRPCTLIQVPVSVLTKSSHPLAPEVWVKFIGRATLNSIARLRLRFSDTTSPRIPSACELVGERDRAFAALEQSLNNGYSFEEINREPELTSLRKDPRYLELLERP